MMPHWHFLTNSLRIENDGAFVAFAARLRKAWSDIIEYPPGAWVYVDNIKTRRGAIYYVTNYCTKDLPPRDILAVMYRARLRGSNVRVPKEPPKGWKAERTVDGETAGTELECPDYFDPSGGWSWGWHDEVGVYGWVREELQWSDHLSADG